MSWNIYHYFPQKNFFIPHLILAKKPTRPQHFKVKHHTMTEIKLHNTSFRISFSICPAIPQLLYFQILNDLHLGSTLFKVPAVFQDIEARLTILKCGTSNIGLALIIYIDLLRYKIYFLRNDSTILLIPVTRMPRFLRAYIQSVASIYVV